VNEQGYWQPFVWFYFHAFMCCVHIIGLGCGWIINYRSWPSATRTMDWRVCASVCMHVWVCWTFARVECHGFNLAPSTNRTSLAMLFTLDSYRGSKGINYENKWVGKWCVIGVKEGVNTWDILPLWVNILNYKKFDFKLWWNKEVPLISKD